MADPPPHPEAGDDTGMPRWVKASGVIVGVVILLVVILALTGVLGGQHGPGRHLPGGDRPGGHTPPMEHGP